MVVLIRGVLMKEYSKSNWAKSRAKVAGTGRFVGSGSGSVSRGEVGLEEVDGICR